MGDLISFMYQCPSLCFHRNNGRWEEVVTHHPRCLISATRPAGRLLIHASIIPIDGESQTLGRASPTYVRSDCRSISVEGYMEFDVADIEYIESIGLFEGVILHEMGRVIGVGYV